MPLSWASQVLLACCLAGTLGEGAIAAPQATPLHAALDRLAMEAKIELLYDERLVDGKSAPSTKSGDSLEQTLRRLLRGTGLTFRRTARGAYLLTQESRNRDHGAVSRAEPTAAPAVADILVMGRRTLNSDIARTADDTQAYQVSEAEDVERAQPSSVDDYLRTRLTENTQALALSQAPRLNGGATRSQVDLRGLGTAQTLILINGRRLPRVLFAGTLMQSDVSALPIASVERIETLGTTAGGIFGIGAAGGSVNLITKSDFRGIDLGIRSGISDRGDAAQRTLDAHIGLTNQATGTRMSVRISRSVDEGLTFGDRSFITEARKLRYSRDVVVTTLPVSPSLNIFSTFNSSLTLLPKYGGGALNASRTFLPQNSPELSSGGANILLANAGRFDLALAPGALGTDQSLVTPTRTTVVMTTLRQDVGDSGVLFADFLRLDSVGRADTAGLDTTTRLAPGTGGNPFAQDITVTYPVTGAYGEARSRTVTERLTLGAIWRLGRGWTANVDASEGWATSLLTTSQTVPFSQPVNLFGGVTSGALQSRAVPNAPTGRLSGSNRLRDLNVRLAGPLLRLPAGVSSMTLTGELREERSPGEITQYYPGDPTLSRTIRDPSQRQRVGSIFLEGRAPVLTRSSPLIPLRGLELQLALRYDRYAFTVPNRSLPLLNSGIYGAEVTNRHGVASLTAGFQTRPLGGLVLRGSYANGYTPPTATQITPDAFSSAYAIYSDPKRPGEAPISALETLYVINGSPSLRPQHATTLSAGFIATPSIVPGLRLSIDYSRLTTSREINDFANLDFQYFVDHESDYPGRITRAVLTAADIAEGYSAGRITVIDTSSLAAGRSKVEAVDISVRYDRESTIGAFQLYAVATWQPSLRRRDHPTIKSYDLVGQGNGPLAVRGNAGLSWTGDRLSATVNAQFYASYGVAYAFSPGSPLYPGYQVANARMILEQGGSRIPAQAYLDASVSLRSSPPGVREHEGSVVYRLGVKNVLGSRPPGVVPPLVDAFDEIGYSSYGDARGRRFQLDVSVRY